MTIRLERRDWSSLGLLLLLAAALRVVFFSGGLGSDEIVYTSRALDILGGDWTPSSYIGAIRYGINLPLAVAFAILGPTIAAIGALYVLSSVAEVALVFTFARLAWGRREAVLSALILATLPLHVFVPGALLADAWLAVFITGTFLLFFMAERHRNPTFYFLAGITAGLVFSIKEVVIVFVLVFGLYATLIRQWKREWAWSFLGASMTFALNATFFTVVYDDPLYVLKVMTARTALLSEGDIQLETGPSYYLTYLFIKVYHTWLLGFLAVAGAVLALVRRDTEPSVREGVRYVLVWAGGLLLVFSLFPMSLVPFALAPKQTNYMAIFLAPLALLSGYLVARLRLSHRVAILTVMLGGSVALAAAEQVALRTFTANSRAALEFAASHSDLPIYGTTNNSRIAYLHRLVAQSPESFVPIRPIPRGDALVDKEGDHNDMYQAYVIVDWETMDWGSEHLRVSTIPACWEWFSELRPAQVGLGYVLLGGVLQGFGLVEPLLPQELGARVRKAVSSRLTPQPATVYRVRADCVRGMDAGSPRAFRTG